MNHTLARTEDGIHAAGVPASFLIDERNRYAFHAADPRRAMGMLRDTLGGRIAMSAEHLTLTAIECLGHKPGRRCLFRYDLTSGNRLQGPPSTQSVVGKLRRKGVDRRSFAVQRRLYENGFGPTAGDRIHVSEPLEVVPTFSMWLQRHVGGRTLERTLAEQTEQRLIPRAAEALAKLHNANLPSDRLHLPQDELDFVLGRLEEVRACLPAFAGDLDAIADRCRKLAAGLPDDERVGIHRDFHPGQLLDDDDRLHLLDFDLFAAGDPAVDVGNFAAHLLELGLRHHGIAEVCEPLVDLFVASYLKIRPQVSRDSIEAYTKLTLARHIWISITRPGRGHTTERLISLCREQESGTWAD